MINMTVIILAFLYSTGPGPESLREPDSIRAELLTLQDDVLKVEITGISEDGVLHARADGLEKSFPIDDLMRITPSVRKPSTSSSADAPMRTLLLSDGGQLRGNFQQSTDTVPSRSLHVALTWGETIDIPFAALAGIRLVTKNAPQVDAEFLDRMKQRKPGRDLVALVKDDKLVVVPGSLERLDSNGWEFRFGEKSRTGTLDEAYGFILGAPPSSGSDLPVEILLAGGDRFGVRILSASASDLKFDAGLLGRVTVPWTSVESIEVSSRRIVYLSDMEPIESQQRSIVGGGWSLQRDRTVTNEPIHLRNRVYRKGLGVHAYSSVTYRLDASFERFSATIGIDDSAGVSGNVIFRILADGKKVYESPNQRGGAASSRVSVDTSGVKSLTLECDYGEGLDIGDHAVWADAKLTRTNKSNPATPGVRPQ